jgi:putative selenate reductase molybdopterin-binding subunit
MGCSTTRVSSGTFASVGMMVPTKAVENAFALWDKILAYASRKTGEKRDHCKLVDDHVLCGRKKIALTELYARGAKEDVEFDALRKAYGSPRTVAFIAYGVRLALHRITGEIVILYSAEAVDAGVVMNSHQFDAIGPLGSKSIAENTNNPVPPAH